MMSFSPNENELTHRIDDTQNISIYPNPLSDDFMFLEAENQGLISIFTKDGERIFREDYDQGLNKYEIDHIPPGKYTFKIVSDGSMSIASFEMTRN